MHRLIVCALFVAAFAGSTAHPARAQEASSASAPPVTLRGVAVDAESGAGLPRARLDVIVGGKRAAGTFTRDDGTFIVGITAPDRLSIAPFATLTVRTFKAGYATIAVTFTPQQVRSPDGVRLVIPRAGVITGRVVPGPLGLHAAALVFARRGGDGSTFDRNVFTAPSDQTMFSASPDEDGNFRLGGLPAGRYSLEVPVIVAQSADGVRVAASAGGVRMASVVVDVRAGAEISADLVFERAPDEPSVPTAPGPTEGSVIRGRVTAPDGTPLSNAMVNARAAGRSWSASTDAAGSFTFNGLPAGSFTISAVRRGYIRGEYGQRGADLPGLPVIVEKGKNVDNVVVTLARGAVVSGIVVDEHNEPLPDVTVQLSRVRSSTIGLAMVEPSAAGRLTDDRGMFRIPDVRPGDYLLTAALPAEVTTETSGTRTAFVPAFYPDTHDASGALPLRLQGGDVVSTALLTLRRVPVVRVAGVVQGSQGTPSTGSLRLLHRHIGGFALPPRVAEADARGVFAFAEVPPGEYVLRASSSGPNGPEAAERGLTIVDSDPEPLSIRTMPRSTVSGHFVLDAPPGELLWGYSIRTLTADAPSAGGGMTNLGSPTGNGESFRITSLSGPTRLVVSTEDDDWYVRSIAIDGIDATDAPFDFGFDGRQYTAAEIVFSRFGAAVGGRATDDRAVAVNDYAVYVFPTDRDKWFTGSRWLKLVRSTGDGTFRAAGLPPGEYWFAAVDRVDTMADSRDWVDPDLLESLAARATRVAVGEKQEQTLTLRVIRR